MEKIWEKFGEILADLGNWDFKIFFLFVSCFSFAGLMVSGTIIGIVAIDRILAE